MQEPNVKEIEIYQAPHLPGWIGAVFYAITISFGYLAVMGATWPIYGLACLATLGMFMFTNAYNTAVSLYNSQKIMSLINDIVSEGTKSNGDSLSECKGEDDEEAGS